MKRLVKNLTVRARKKSIDQTVLDIKQTDRRH